MPAANGSAHSQLTASETSDTDAEGEMDGDLKAALRDSLLLAQNLAVSSPLYLTPISLQRYEKTFIRVLLPSASYTFGIHSAAVYA